MKLLVLFFLLSCASSQKENNATGQSRRPPWVEDTNKYCGDEKLCAVGEGTGGEEASARGREGLAKIFETRVSSHSQAHLNYAQGQVGQETFSRHLQESTNLVLEGAKVEKRWQRDKVHYALVSLERFLGARILRQRIDSLDQEIEALYKSDRRSALGQALSLYDTRDALSIHYLILRPTPIDPRVTRAQLHGKRESLGAGGGQVIFLEKRDGEFQSFYDGLIRELLDLNYRVVTKSQEKFDFRVEAAFRVRKGHMNVEGFERHIVSLGLSSFSSGGQRVGHLSLEVEETGRSRDHAVERALARLNRDASEKIEELNLHTP